MISIRGFKLLNFPFTEKKPKSKKEKPSDASDGISDLLAQMSLQSSSSANCTTRPQTLLPKISNPEEPEVVVILDTPVSQKQHSNPKDAHSPNTPLSNSESDAAASPSVSAVVDALHLSDIDWEASSFTSSPPPQAATNHTAGLKRNVQEAQDENTSGDVKHADSRSAPGLSYTDCPLRDRVLMRNTAKAITQRDVHHDVVSKQLNYELASLERITPHNFSSKPSGQVSSKGNSDGKYTGKESDVNKKAPLTDKSQSLKNKAETQTSKQSLISSIRDQCKPIDKCNGSQKPPQKYKFVRTAISSSAAPHQRCHSDPGQSDKDRDVPQTTKKTVCLSVCSSSEDSDAENQQFGPQRKAKVKPLNKVKTSSLISAPESKTIKQQTAKPTPSLQRHSADVEISTTPVSSRSKCQDVPAAPGENDVLTQTPASPLIVSDNDDSVICSESPLPLAERLRLKFLK